MDEQGWLLVFIVGITLILAFGVFYENDHHGTTRCHCAQSHR